MIFWVELNLPLRSVQLMTPSAGVPESIQGSSLPNAIESESESESEL